MSDAPDGPSTAPVADAGVHAPAIASSRPTFLARLAGAEDAFALALLLAMTALPLLEILARQAGTAIPGAIRWVHVITGITCDHSNGSAKCSC